MVSRCESATRSTESGAKPAVILRAVRDFWSLRLRLWANPRRAIRRGAPILGS